MGSLALLFEPPYRRHYFLAAGETLEKISACFNRVAREDDLLTQLRGRYPQLSEVMADTDILYDENNRLKLTAEGRLAFEWTLKLVFPENTGPEGWVKDDRAFSRLHGGVVYRPPKNSEDSQYLKDMTATMTESSLRYMRVHGLARRDTRVFNIDYSMLPAALNLPDWCRIQTNRIGANRYLIEIGFRSDEPELPNEIVLPGAVKIDEVDAKALECRRQQDGQTGFDKIMANNGERPWWRRALRKPSF